MKHGPYMKRLTAVFLVVLALFAMSMTCYADTAATDEILYGTPEIDGKLDDMYKSSYFMDVDNFAFATWAPEGEEAPTYENPLSARSYLVWDEYYLYVCTVVNDPTVMSVGQAFLTLPSNWDTYQNDCVEMWICDNGGNYKITIDAYGYNTYIGIGSGAPTFKKADINSVTTVDEEGGQYIVEAAIPLPEVGPGKDFGYSIQVNDLISEEHGICTSSLVSCIGNKLNFVAVSATSGEQVDVTVITVPETTRKPRETKETTAKPETQEGETTKGADTTAPSAQILKPRAETDNGIPVWVWIVSAAAVVAVVVVVVVVVSKKKKD